MLIKDLKPKTPFDFINLKILQKFPSKEYEKFGKKGKVCNLIGQDESKDEVTLTLFGDDIDKIDKGETVKITNGWCSDYFNNKFQISLGKSGKVEKPEISEKIVKNEEKKPEQKEPEKPIFTKEYSKPQSNVNHKLEIEDQEYEEEFTDEFIEELDDPLI